MNDFTAELRDLIEKYKDHPGVLLEEIVDALESAAEDLAEELFVRVA